jgi:sugar (pentulose or hexulose) kinase
MVQGKTHETSGLGAAIVTAVGLKLYASFSEAIENMVTQAHRFDPEPAAVKIYDQLYQRVYQRMYKALAPLYRDIKKITGYPE